MSTTTYRTLLRTLLTLPDPEILCYYRTRYRTLCRDAQRARTKASEAGFAAGGESVRMWQGRMKRYEGLLDKELRRVQAASRVVRTGEWDATPGREARRARKEGLRAYERMVDHTYARAGPRRWEVLDTMFPPEKRSPTREGSRGPPPLPAELIPLLKTVNTTAPCTRDRSLRDRFASESYKAWRADKRAWYVRRKLLRGCAVPLGPGIGGPRWDGLRRCAETMSRGVAWRVGVGVVASGAFPEVARQEARLARPVRRVYERLVRGLRGGGGGAEGDKWVPPWASEEDRAWIRGGEKG
ncbi:hypothetical protein NliqN6_4557 [Naganishia liquefaciens]|uniref:Uncharacterized protein n=1 Tax=Naganishia liquefaciens TaxID=104408 RepID=A0A8H3TWN4_9TREE|nr:hypothetical protein NliqN6_4557 [Naganishia liquefaciens]